MKRPFEQAVTEHGTVVLRVCRAVLGVEEADDAWSETFLSALRAWPGLPDDADVRATMDSLFRSVGLRTALFESASALMRAPLPDAECCLVVDVLMPELSGLEFQRKLAERGVTVVSRERFAEEVVGRRPPSAAGGPPSWADIGRRLLAEYERL